MTSKFIAALILCSIALVVMCLIGSIIHLIGWHSSKVLILVSATLLVLFTVFKKVS